MKLNYLIVIKLINIITVSIAWHEITCPPYFWQPF